MNTELVVLVDEKNNVLGTLPKSSVHRKETPLHRGFSIFLFNERKELLLQQRSNEKQTWPLAWSNSCCGHPGLNETTDQAAKRRLSEELGLRDVYLTKISPYRYCFTKDDIMENEICPILFGYTMKTPTINKNEIEEISWITWKKFLASIKSDPEKYSPWCKEEATILNNSSTFHEHLNKIPTLK
ncbi:MAG: isopentenyl-diphosphate Delta-isomerase [bacterium]